MKNYFNFSYKYYISGIILSFCTIIYGVLRFSSSFPSHFYFFLSWTKYLHEGLNAPTLPTMLPGMTYILNSLKTLQFAPEYVLCGFSICIFLLSTVFLYQTALLLKGKDSAYATVVALCSSLGSLIFTTHLPTVLLTYLGQQIIFCGFIYTLRTRAYWWINAFLPLLAVFLDTGPTVISLIVLSSFLLYFCPKEDQRPIVTLGISSALVAIISLWLMRSNNFSGMFADLGHRIYSAVSAISIINYFKNLLLTFLIVLFPWNGFIESLWKKSAQWEDIVPRIWFVSTMLLIPLKTQGIEINMGPIYTLGFYCLAPYSLLIGQWVTTRSPKTTALGFGLTFFIGIVLCCFLLEFIIKLQNIQGFFIPFLGISCISIIGLFWAFFMGIRQHLSKSLVILFLTSQVCYSILGFISPLFIDSTNQIFSNTLLKHLKTEDEIIFHPQVQLYGIPYHTEHEIKILDTSVPWPFYTAPETLQNVQQSWKSSKTLFLILPKSVYIKNLQQPYLDPFFVLESTPHYIMGTNRALILEHT